MHESHIGATRKRLMQCSDKTRVNLECRDLCASVRKCQCESTETCTDLQHVVALADARERGDTSHGLRFDDKVLPERAPWRQPVTGEQLRGLRPSEGHQVSATGIGALTRSESSTKSRVCKTITTLAGVEGIITFEHAIERPLSRFFTTSVTP